MIYVKDRVITEKRDILARLPWRILTQGQQLKDTVMKECTKCQREQPHDQFYKVPLCRNKSGFTSWCKSCTKERGEGFSPERKALASIRARCNKGRTDHKYYYDKGIKVSDREIAALNIEKDAFHGEWNYTIKPRIR